MAKETVPNRRYTDEFKLEALRLAGSVGINQAAKRLGTPSSSLGNWARLKRSGKLGELPRAGPIKGSPTELQSLKQSLASVHERIPQRCRPVCSASQQAPSLNCACMIRHATAQIEL